MNKYQKSMNLVKGFLKFYSLTEVVKPSILQELVDKSIHKKVVENCDDFECPTCHEYVFLGEDVGNYQMPKFCHNCGQALDSSSGKHE